MKLCIKIGGAQLEESGARRTLARAIARARGAGHSCVVVHGGGNQIRALGKRCGIEDRYHDGLRITDAATAEIAVAVLAGTVGKALAESMSAAGAPAVSLCGADGGLFTARKHSPGGVDLGYVGQVARVDRKVVDALHLAGLVPLIATVAPLDSTASGPNDHLYNINADHAVAPLGRALGCDAILFLTDVEGVLDADKQRIGRLTPADCERLRSAGVIKGGMIPKVEAALDALHALPGGIVKIAPAAGTDAVLDALREDCGTLFSTTCADAMDANDPIGGEPTKDDCAHG